MHYIYRFATPFLIAVFSLIFTVKNIGLYDALRYDRSAILSGELWRILTGNLTHADMNHLIINIVGLWILWLIFSNEQRKQYEMLIAIIFTSIGTCTGLLLLEPQLKWYVGLSGALHGLFAAGIIISFKSEPRFHLFMGLLLVTKLAYEQFMGPLPGSEKTITVPVIVNSHLYGAISGVVVGFIFILYKNLYTKHQAKCKHGSH